MDRSDPAAINAAHRFFAVECNNEAWRLTELPVRTAEETEQMVHHAHAAALHWSVVGTTDNTAKAWALLAQAHALAGNGALADRYARLNLDHVLGVVSPDWEVAFAYLIAANAAAAAGDASRHKDFKARATAAGEQIADPEDKAIFMTSFNVALHL